MPYSLYGGPHDGRVVDIAKLTSGHYTVPVLLDGRTEPVDYHLRTIRAKVATGGTLMIDVLAHSSPCNEAALWAQVLEDFATEIDGAEIKPYELQFTQGASAGRLNSHLRLADLPLDRLPSTYSSISEG